MLRQCHKTNITSIARRVFRILEENREGITSKSLIEIYIFRFAVRERDVGVRVRRIRQILSSNSNIVRVNPNTRKYGDKYKIKTL